ncbi:MAG: hypothetical protein ABIJ65_01615 [Chloroflexota bacterium]
MSTPKNTLIIIILAVSPILLLGLALMLILIPLPVPFPISGSNARNMMAAIVTGILGLVWLIALSVYLVKAILMAGSVFDTFFTTRGLSSSNYLGLGRQYQGRLEGRQVEAQFSPGRMLQNSLLNIRIETDIDQHMAIGESKPLLDCNDCEKVDFSPNPLDSIKVYAQDKAWAQSVLLNPSNVELIKSLMDDQEGLGKREFYLKNKQGWLHARPTSRLKAAHLQIWFLTMFDLLSSIEKTN